MSAHVRIVALVLTAGVFVLIVDLIRRRQLMERYALLWLLSGTVLLILEIWGNLLELTGRMMGIFYPPTALFLIAFGFVLAILVHFSIVISALTSQNKVLAQRIGLLQQQLGDRPAPHPAALPAGREDAPRRRRRAPGAAAVKQVDAGAVAAGGDAPGSTQPESRAG